MPLNYVCRSVCLLPLLAIDDGTPPFVSSKAVDILPPGCRRPTPSPRATLVPLRINPQSLAAQFLNPARRPRPDLATARFCHQPSQFRTLAQAIARPAKRSPIAVSWNSGTFADSSFRGLGEGIDSTLHAPGDGPRLE